MNETLPWMKVPPSPQHDLCKHCIEYRETFELSVAESFDYFYFPFDYQTINFKLGVDGGDIFSCASVMNPDGINVQLPDDDSWILTSSKSEASGSGDVCHIKIQIRRNFLLFFVKNIIVLMIIIQVALISLWLNPRQPPLLSGRFSIQIFAMVLVSLRMQTDLEDLLGLVTMLQWIDLFYLYQFVVVLISIIETAVVHHFIRLDKDVLAIRIDHVFRILMPLVLYPLGTLGMLMWASFQNPVLGGILGSLGLLLPIVFGVLRVRYVQRRYEKKKRKIAIRLAEATIDELDDQSDDPLLGQAFALFDVDASGTIDHNEMRTVLKAMYPYMPRSHQKVALHLQEEHIHGDDGVRFDRFDDIILAWREYSAAHDPDGRCAPHVRTHARTQAHRHAAHACTHTYIEYAYPNFIPRPPYSDSLRPVFMGRVPVGTIHRQPLALLCLFSRKSQTPSFLYTLSSYQVDRVE